jgi:prevent-host-death family protein
MAEPLNLYEAKTQLSALVDRAAGGEEIVIAKAGKPMARLVPLERRAAAPRQFGQNVLGITYIAPDFDAPLPKEILASFYGDVEPEGDPIEAKREPIERKNERIGPKGEPVKMKRKRTEPKR